MADRTDWAEVPQGMDTDIGRSVYLPQPSASGMGLGQGQSAGNSVYGPNSTPYMPTPVAMPPPPGPVQSQSQGQLANQPMAWSQPQSQLVSYSQPQSQNFFVPTKKSSNNVKTDEEAEDAAANEAKDELIAFLEAEVERLSQPISHELVDRVEFLERLLSGVSNEKPLPVHAPRLSELQKDVTEAKYIGHLSIGQTAPQEIPGNDLKPPMPFQPQVQRYTLPPVTSYAAYTGQPYHTLQYQSVPQFSHQSPQPSMARFLAGV